MNEQGQACGYPPTDHVADTSEILANVLNSLADRFSNHEHLPKMMPEKFSGDLLQCPHWSLQDDSGAAHHCCEPKNVFLETSNIRISRNEQRGGLSEGWGNPTQAIWRQLHLGKRVQEEDQRLAIREAW